MKIQQLINRSNIKANPHRRRGGVMAGCLIALGVVVVLAIIGVVILVIFGKGWFASGMNAAAKAAVQATTLPTSEKADIDLVMDDLRDRFKNGDIDLEQYASIFTDMFESKAFPIGNAYALNTDYIQASAGLTDEEKQDGVLQLQRAAQGLHDGQIDIASYSAIFAPMTDDGTEIDIKGNELVILRKPGSITDDELRTAIELARTLADDNSVTDSPVVFDISDMLKADIDNMIGGAPAPTSTPALEDADAEDES